MTVTMTEPDMAGVVVNSTAQVSTPSKRRPLARPRVARVAARPRVVTKRVAVVRRRAEARVRSAMAPSTADFFPEVIHVDGTFH